MKCPSCGNENREGAKFCDTCGAGLEQASAVAPTASPPVTERLPEPVAEGRYVAARFLGHGGRKRVYLARDTLYDREVALAMFDTEGMDEAVLARARREAQAMGKLGESPHIVTVYDSGEEGGAPFIVSQFMPGGDVAGLLAQSDGRRLPIERALEIADHVARALEHAHALGIVHRDIKPANVWLAEDGSARLGDFGLATTGARSREAVDGMLVGTVAYLPPEQALGRAADARSDLYSLGALIYEMLTGQPPFPGDDAVAIIGQHLNATPVAPSRFNDAVPPALDELVLQLLAKRPDDRPASAAELRRLLVEAQRAPVATATPEVEERDENPLDRLAGGVFVGRESELGELRGALDEALGGRGRLLLLVGEPGVGKTRTAEELATYARVRGAKVYWGRCLEDDAAPPYWPWSRAIRDYVRDADPVALAWEMGSGAGEIARLVPEVVQRVSGVEPASLDPEGEQARFRLFDAVAGFLTGASRDRPLVLVLDDLHWADEPSLLLLQFLSRQLGDSGLLVVGTYRDVELGRHHPLAKMLGELSERGTRISLRGLSADDVARYIEMTSGSEPPAELVKAVHEQTEGNPFFVSEVVRLLVSEGMLERSGQSWELSIPQGVREVIGRRLDRLSPEANEVLRIAAAVGRRFGLEIVERVGGRADTRDLLQQAVAARLLREIDPPDPYLFSHALVRETLYEEISPPQRVELHRRIGEELEGLYAADPESHLDELARHFLEAAPGGDVAKAIDYATRAGKQAMCDLAYEEAAEDFGRALEVADLQSGLERHDRCRLLLALAESQMRAGRPVVARQRFEEAAALAGELEEPELLAKAALGMVAVAETGGADEAIIAVVERALKAIGEEDSALRALLLSGLAQELYWVDAQGKAAPLSQEAVEIARRLGDPRTLAATLRRHYFATAGPQASEQQLALTAEMVRLAEQAGDRELAMTAHVYALNSHLVLGDVAAADRELEAYARIAEGLRQPQHLWHIPLLRAMRAMMGGRFEETARLTEEARAGGERAGEPLASQFAGIQTSIRLRYQGDVDVILAEVRRLADRYPAVVAWRCALSALYTEAGQMDEARTELERLAEDGFASIPFDAQWIGGVSLVSEACANLGDAERAPGLYDLLAPYDGLVVVAGRAAACYGPVARHLGLLSRTMGRLDEAVAHLESAVELSTRMGDRPQLALGRCDLARALLDRGRAGDRERAIEMLGASIEAAQEMGMKRLVEQALAVRLEAQGLGSIDVTTSIDSVISAVQSERPDLAAHAAPDGSVTILFSDIENSTLMTERLGDERWLELLRAHNDVFRRRLHARGGYEVKNQGDGFMLVFPSPRQALECAIEVQRELAARAEESPAEAIRVRMGLHAGEAIHEEGDFFGKNVILAARIAAEADGGEILVSDHLKEKAESEGEDGELCFDGGREIELKGLAGTHRVYRAQWDAALSSA